MKSALLILSLLVLAGMANGVMDTLQFHYAGSRFERMSEQAQRYWNPRHVEIVRLASGVLRFRDGSANYVLDILSDNWIRVRNYPGAPAMLDLFFDGDSWIDASGNLGTVTYRLRKT